MRPCCAVSRTQGRQQSLGRHWDGIRAYVRLCRDDARRGATVGLVSCRTRVLCCRACYVRPTFVPARIRILRRKRSNPIIQTPKRPKIASSRINRACHRRNCAAETFVQSAWKAGHGNLMKTVREYSQRALGGADDEAGDHHRQHKRDRDTEGENSTTPYPQPAG
jgi:hypothetical protein